MCKGWTTKVDSRGFSVLDDTLLNRGITKVKVQLRERTGATAREGGAVHGAQVEGVCDRTSERWRFALCVQAKQRYRWRGGSPGE